MWFLLESVTTFIQAHLNIPFIKGIFIPLKYCCFCILEAGCAREAGRALETTGRGSVQSSTPTPSSKLCSELKLFIFYGSGLILIPGKLENLMRTTCEENPRSSQELKVLLCRTQNTKSCIPPLSWTLSRISFRAPKLVYTYSRTYANATPLLPFNTARRRS